MSKISVPHIFTSESVSEGHPDKVCDQISDAVLDAIIADDPMARVACETTCTTGMVFVMGEITTSAYVDIPSIVRDTVKEIGYDGALTIEREDASEEQKRIDIIDAKEYLEKLI